MRQTQRVFKVYKNGKVFHIENVTKFSEGIVKALPGRKMEERKIWRSALAALNSSKQKITNFKKYGKLPRTKTSFLKTGFYLFDNSIEDNLIKSYMELMIKSRPEY